MMRAPEPYDFKEHHVMTITAVQYRIVMAYGDGTPFIGAPYREPHAAHAMAKNLRRAGMNVNSVVKLTPKQPPATIQDDLPVTLRIPTRDDLV